LKTGVKGSRNVDDRAASKAAAQVTNLQNDYDEYVNSIIGVSSNATTNDTAYMFARALNTGAVATLLGKLPLA
jgi:hypothetical protein